MAVRVDSAEFTDDTRLFYSKGSANTWRLNLTVPTAATAKEGVVLKCAHVGDITTIDGIDLAAAGQTGSGAEDQTSIGLKDLATDAGTREALIILAEKINFLTYRLEQAGIMASS